jgi:uncharacterized membrane protein YdjX (TVP38/TMEM64 family)
MEKYKKLNTISAYLFGLPFFILCIAILIPLSPFNNYALLIGISSMPVCCIVSFILSVKSIQMKRTRRAVFLILFSLLCFLSFVVYFLFLATSNKL